MTATKPLYDEIVEAGIEYDSYCSDLYLPATPRVDEILARYPLEKSNTTTFISNIDGKRWHDVPFSYMPFWRSRSK